MAQKKVIFLASFLNVAGAQEAALRVARGLRERNYDTEVWFLYAEAKPPEIDQGVRILLDVTKPTALQYLKIAVTLLRELRKAKPYALVSFLPLANVLGQSMALLAGVRRRIASHRAPWRTFGRAMRYADSVIGTLGVYSSAIAVTQLVRQSYDGHPAHYRKRISVVYNGLAWTPSLLSRAEARQKFGLPEDRFIAVTLGRLKPVKNYPFLVRVAEGLERGMIVAAGDGPLWQEIETMIETGGSGDRMKLLGAVAKSDVADLYRAADCFLLASFFEGQSNALLEAMHNGTPVIVSDKPEQRETVVDCHGELAGLALGLDEPSVWSQAIEGMAADPERCAALSAAAKRRAGDFTLDRQLAGFAAVIEGQDPPEVTDLTEPAAIPAKS
ncbi:MAG: glycosyltransferase family 4 protein [Geminicoccaceae bacterium]